MSSPENFTQSAKRWKFTFSKELHTLYLYHRRYNDNQSSTWTPGIDSMSLTLPQVPLLGRGVIFSILHIIWYMSTFGNPLATKFLLKPERRNDTTWGRMRKAHMTLLYANKEYNSYPLYSNRQSSQRTVQSQIKLFRMSRLIRVCVTRRGLPAYVHSSHIAAYNIAGA